MFNNRRALAAVMASALLVLSACGGAKPANNGSTDSGAKKVKVAMLVSNLGDRSFNDMGWDGLKKAGEDMKDKVQVKVQEAPEVAALEENAVKFAKDGWDELIFLSYTYSDLVKKLAPQYPNTKFVMIDAEASTEPNVRNVLFKDHEGSFLAGAAAAMKATNGKVGFIGGKDIPLIQRFGAGFVQGAKYVNPNIQVETAYVGSFVDAAKGKELAMVMYNKGVDVVYAAAGGSGAGVIEAAKQAQKWAFGVDSNQDHLSPEAMLGSMMKRVDNAVYTAIKDAVDGTFKGGTISMGVKEEGLSLSGFAPISSEISIKNLGTANYEKLAKIRQDIADGKIKVEESLAK